MIQSHVGLLLTLTNMERREKLSQFKLQCSNSFEKLDSTTKCILDAIIDQQDVFQVAHEAQLTLCKDTIRNIDDARQEIIQEIRVTFISYLFNPILTLF